MKAQSAVLRSGLFALVALVAMACGGGGSNPPPPTTSPAIQTSDVLPPGTPPNIYWSNTSAIGAGNIVRGQIMLNALGRWTPTGTKQVDFFVDDVAVYTTENGGKWPGVALVEYFWSWDTRTVANGAHRIFARVTDKSGATADTATLDVIVSN